MSLRFSLLGLVIFTALAALASAALARPDAGWLSLIVSATAAAVGVQLLRAMLLDGEARAAAIGWLAFATAYVLLFVGPWFSSYLAPHLLTSKGIAYAQAKWAAAAQESMARSSYDPPAQGWIDVPSSLGSNLSLLMAARYDPSGFAGQNLFALTAHWLFVWIAAAAGSSLAITLHRRQRLQTSAADCV